ncbi:MAG: hypothetical protein ABJF04_16625 [Reichenbachiella sp.]|uniref:Hpt domain-containing protein n=1 Tax=Reichenbachiella sp. TaxID=2184521 RepID=UPI003265C608
MISFNYLNETFPGDTELIDQVIDIYLSEYPTFIAQFKTSVMKGDYKEMKELAHKWQYTAKVLGLKGLYSDLKLLGEYNKLVPFEMDQITARVAYLVEENYIELLAYKAAS